MRLDRYERVADFLDGAGTYLGAREAEHNLILGVADSAGRSPDLFDGPPYLAVVRDDTEVVAAALRTPPYNLLLSEVMDSRAVGLLVDDLSAASLPGAVGPPTAARSFAEQWVARNGGSWQVRMEERIYALKRVLPPRLTEGRMREADASDLPLMESWLDSFAREAMPTEATGQIRRTLEEWRRGTRRFWLWDAGEPVSLVGAGGRTPHGVRIGPVYTPPERRGRGYASALTAGVSALLLSEGCRFCFLYTDLANPTSNRIYQAIGYEPVTDALIVAFER